MEKSLATTLVHMMMLKARRNNIPVNPDNPANPDNPTDNPLLITLIILLITLGEYNEASSYVQTAGLITLITTITLGMSLIILIFICVCLYVFS